MMCDSPEVIKVEKMMEVIKEEVNNISDVEDGPDQENNIKEKIVQNNNDCSVEDLEMMSRMDKELIIEEEIRIRLGDGVRSASVLDRGDTTVWNGRFEVARHDARF